MSVASSFEEGLQKAFAPTAHGIVGLVDQLLAFCRVQDAVFEWREGRLRCRPIEGEGETVEVPLPKAAFRPMLARVAALCNQHKPDSVSPYGGVGEIAAGGNPPRVLRVTFTNTPGTRVLEVRDGRSEALEKVLSLLQRGKTDCKSGDSITILALGSAAVSAIRDPQNWAVLEPYLYYTYQKQAMLTFAGTPLAAHWLFSSSAETAYLAQEWARKNWRTSWEEFTDPMKRHLVEHFEFEMQRAQDRLDGAESIRRGSLHYK